MKPFSLDIVLDYRQRLEDAARNDFFVAKNQKKILEREIVQKENEQIFLIEECEKLKQESCPILDLITIENKISYIRQHIKELYTLLEKKETLVRKAHAHLVTRSKEKKVMEKLKEKQNAEWQKYINKKEAAMLDEIAILRHTR